MRDVLNRRCFACLTSINAAALNCRNGKLPLKMTRVWLVLHGLLSHSPLKLDPSISARFAEVCGSKESAAQQINLLMARMVNREFGEEALPALTVPSTQAAAGVATSRSNSTRCNKVWGQAACRGDVHHQRCKVAEVHSCGCLRLRQPVTAAVLDSGSLRLRK